MAIADIKPVSRKYVFAFMADSSSPSSAFAASPCRGQIMRMGTVIYNAITVGNTNMTAKVNGVATGFAWVIVQAASAAGQVNSSLPLLATTRSLLSVKENDTIEWVSDGGGTTTAPTMCWAEIEMD